MKIIAPKNGKEVTLTTTDIEVFAIAERIDCACGEDGIIAAEDMVELFPGQPTLHSATSIYRALIEAGMEELPE